MTFNIFPTRKRARMYLGIFGILIAIKTIWFLALETTGEELLQNRVSHDVMSRRAYLVKQVFEALPGPERMTAQIDPLFQGEWAMGTYSMFAAALTSLAFLHPESREEAARIIGTLVERVERREFRDFDTRSWSEDAIDSLPKGRGHIGYLGHLNWMYGAFRLTGGDNRFDEKFKRLTAELAGRLAKEPSLCAETYPDEVYVPDNVVVLASIRNHDRVFGAHHEALLGRWIAHAKRNLLDTKTQLLAFKIDRSGEMLQGGRGSGAGWNSFYLPHVEPHFAQEQYAQLKRHLVKRLFGGITGIREYPAGVEGSGDVDSGPVVLDLSTSGTGFAIAGARHTQDAVLLGQLLSTAELVGTTVPWGGGRHYLLAPLVGEAIMLAMKTAMVWDDRYVRR